MSTFLPINKTSGCFFIISQPMWAKKNPPLSVVRVSVGLSILVMDTMITNPNVDIILERNAVKQHHHNSESKSSFVSTSCVPTTDELQQSPQYR